MSVDIVKPPLNYVHVYKTLRLVVINKRVYGIAPCSEYLLNFHDMSDFIFEQHSVMPHHNICFLTFKACFTPMFGVKEVGCAMLLDNWMEGQSYLSRIIMLQRRVRWNRAKPRRLCAAMALHPRLGRYAAVGGLGEDLLKLICSYVQ